MLQPFITASMPTTVSNSNSECAQSLSVSKINTTPSTVLVSNNNANQILLSTAIIKIQDSLGRWVNARALLDAGSEVNIVTHRLATLLQLKLSHNACLIQGVGNSQKPTHVSTTSTIASRYTNYSAKLSFIVMDNITVPLPHTYIQTQTWPIPRQQANSLADPTFYIPSSIDLLIGAELFYSIVETGCMKLGPNLPYLINTTLGWVISGPVLMDNFSVLQNAQPVSMFVTSQSTDQILQSFWEQEELLPQKKSFPRRMNIVRNFLNQPLHIHKQVNT